MQTRTGCTYIDAVVRFGALGSSKDDWWTKQRKHVSIALYCYVRPDAPSFHRVRSSSLFAGVAVVGMWVVEALMVWRGDDDEVGQCRSFSVCGWRLTVLHPHLPCSHPQDNPSLPIDVCPTFRLKDSGSKGDEHANRRLHLIAASSSPIRRHVKNGELNG